MRTRLKNRRQHLIETFTHDGVIFNGQVSFDASGNPLEVFLDGGKVGTAVQNVARDSAVAVSIALQYGAPIETLRASVTRNDNGQPAGPIGALIDLVCGVIKCS